MKHRSLLPLTCFILLGLFLNACGSAQSRVSGNTTYQVAPSFREFYQTLGGEEILGPAISESFTQETDQCQYTVNALLCLNPLVTDASRFSLYSLGKQMGIHDSPSQAPTQSGSKVVDGYTIYAEFLPLYDQLSGEKYAGKPLTQARMNYSQKRIEQYFENIGFYKKFSDPDGTVHLMAYGAFTCKTECNYVASVDAAVSISEKPSENQPLLAGLAKMGDVSVIGSPLTQPYIAADGFEEQVYQNAVVYAPTNNLSQAKLRKLPILLNMIQGTPGLQKYDSSQGVVFYPVSGKKGFHVPLDFDKLIASHGGLDYSGEPINEVFQFDTDVYRQCFENYCLDYDTKAADDDKVRMAPLGSQYINQTGGTDGTDTPTQSISPDTVLLQANMQYQEVTRNDAQKFDILVLRKEDQKPVTNITAKLTITLPDKSLYTAAFPATGMDGRSALVVPAMENLNNGEILIYQICLDEKGSQPVCVSGSYLVWGVK